MNFIYIWKWKLINKSMITYNGSLAIDLNNVKSIYIEYLKPGGNLVFELNNFILTVENPETGELELRSFPNEAVKYYFDSSDVLHAYFEEWVGYWKDSKK